VIACDEPGELGDGVREVLGQRTRAAGLEEREQPAVVPKLIASGLLREALPQHVTFLAIVAHDRGRVVHLVGERDAQDRVVVDIGQMSKIATLTLDPGLRRVRVIHGVAAGLDDRGDASAEAPTDPFKHRPPAAVLDRVVQHCGDCLILIAPVLDHQSSDHQQMGE
jgi:hypothetical protein